MGLLDLKQLKCKTCGEPLDLNNAHDGVIKCGVCDSRFTLPKNETLPEVRDYLNQGGHDLDTGRFDEAYMAFNKAAELDKTEPEAYWGMALAEFKIQYLKDEVNNRLQPICHEVTDKSFADSSNFLKALRYATDAQSEEYENKAKEIEYVMSEFFKLKKSGIDYDCFICVKVSDGNGGRTADYKTADDIYFELKGKGYKPFFSERELAGVTGADYEARILYALSACECMLIVCFDEAYLRTKWVKNEYSRFLKLVNDEEKESDSIALVFGNRPIEKLAGKQGKIQGISINNLTAIERIVSFVESHTPEAKRRREEEAKQKSAGDEALRKKLAEQEELLKKIMGQMNAQTAAPTPTAAPVRPAPNPVPTVTSKPAAVATAKPAATNAANAITVIDENGFLVENGVLKKYKGSEAEVTIPGYVTKIGNNAFEKCGGIKSVKIPDGVTAIGEFAFSGCENLTGITIPNSVKSIGVCAFTRCKKLESIALPDSLRSIGRSAFISCESLTEITIPNGVKSINGSTFSFCNGLEKVVIPASVTSIGGSAFEQCKNLKEIRYGGTKKQWKAVEKEKWWDNKTGKYKLIFSE